LVALSQPAATEMAASRRLVEMARQMVSKAAGVSPDAVKITIQFGM